MSRERPIALIILLSACLFICADVWSVHGEFNRNDNFDLKIENGLITLCAENAPVVEIGKEIGRRMEIELGKDIPATERVSVEVEKLTFDTEALHQIPGSADAQVYFFRAASLLRALT